ncbi:hypothetical protein BDZ94DRAFT_1270889 [Collybia nuda]|uniref:Uncharacterized protein n=1 Tax=Collybia nuda TaxID=64659 RepID=A0A9P5XWZ6_9AGAR|nr:hypothetical protein BDZ94DRAFT_1270889 [Collybia nuda]
MAERNLGRPWTDEEDTLLTAAVKVHGEQDNWKTVALSVPGRTNKACRKRWLHSLSPTIRKSAWTSSEDNLLLDLYNRHGAKWSTIARAIPGRTDDACSKRYREALDPNLKKHEWTFEEDEHLMKLYAEHGGKWGQLGQELQRSGLGCRNRWRLLARKAMKVLYDPISTHSQDAQGQGELQANTSQEQPQSHWPPYYPPEAYHCLSQVEKTGEDHRFTAQDLTIMSVSPDIAPFQFSSSSLSAALSDPPPNPRPLPPIQESDPPPSASPSPYNTYSDDFFHDQMSQDDFPIQDQLELARILSGTHFDSQGFIVGAQNLHTNPPGDLVPGIIYDGWDNLLPDIITLPSTHMSLQSLPGLPIDHHNLPDDISSTLSTPSFFHTSLSTSSSPNAPSPIELSPNEHDLGSLLFSPDLQSQPQKKVHRKALKKSTKPPGPARLSSMLPLTPDPSVRPYACGRGKCWPAGAPESSARFATSKELFDHSKIDHAHDPPGDKPFRCALAGCGKSWKSLNGVQYHLQISTAHFRTALSSNFFSQRVVKNLGRSLVASGSSGEMDSNDEAKRIHVCHHPQCFKAYRQPSGLRYHLRHGHPQEMPAQLNVVPPALARQMPSKTRKMRRKNSGDGNA